MKKLFYLILLPCLCACSNELDTVLEESHSGQPSENTITNHRVDQAEALRQAGLILEYPQTRSAESVQVDYVIDEKAATRSVGNANDTVAYIFNWGENDGFAIVAADDRVFPILAYSEKGKFENEKGSLPEMYFTSRIGDYIEYKVASDSLLYGVVVPDDFVGIPFYESVVRGPYMSCGWCWGEKEGICDWDKYVDEKHPGCAIGCVAVATASMMVHCKDSLTYRGTFFPLDRIREGTRAWMGSPDPSIVPLSREEAVDYAAKLLAWVGEDVDMVYGPEESSASHLKAFDLLESLGFENPIGGPIAYDLDKAINFFLSDNLIMMRGRGKRASDGTGCGHLWVADGYSYWNVYGKYNGDMVLFGTTQKFIRFDWGAAGYGNGYFNGDEFFSGLATYDEDLIMYPIKVENPTSVFWDVYRPDDPNYSDDDDPWWGSNQ